MSKTDLQARFEAPLLGYAWSILGPLIMATVLYFAFTRVVRFGGEIENYPALLIFNIMLFWFFSQAVGRALTSFVTKRNVIQKVEVPLLIAPLSSILSGFILLCATMVVVFGLFIVAFGIEVRWTWLLFPLIMLGFFVVTAAFGLFFASLYVRIRDVSEPWAPISRAMFYGSPVLWPVEFFPESWHFVLYLNPLAPLFAEARVLVLDPNAPTYTETVGGGVYLWLPLGVTLLIAGLAVVSFRWVAPRAAEL